MHHMITHNPKFPSLNKVIKKAVIQKANPHTTDTFRLELTSSDYHSYVTAIRVATAGILATTCHELSVLSRKLAAL